MECIYAYLHNINVYYFGLNFSELFLIPWHLGAKLSARIVLYCTHVLDVIPILSKCCNMEVKNDKMLVYSCCESYVIKSRNVM